MLSRNTKFPDVIIIEPKIWSDERGHFFESFKKSELEQFVGHEINFIQKNESQSSYGVVRGLHYQIAPNAQAKLVSVSYGKVLDIIVDIRKDSETFGQHVSIELTAETGKQIYIPKGFAHGFVTLSEKSNFSYMVDNFYHPESEQGIIHNDKTLDIDWIVKSEDVILSDKDKNLPKFAEVNEFRVKG